MVTALGVVGSGPALARGAKADFINAWEKKLAASNERLKGFCRLGIATDQLVSLFGYGETPAYPRHTEWGKRPEASPHVWRTYSAEQRRWTVKVRWFRHHAELAQLADIRAQAAQAGDNWGTLFERQVFQTLLASADGLLLPAIANCPDGVGMFSATDGASAARFGLSGGNIESGASLTTGEGVRTAVMASIERILRFQDPQGQPQIGDDQILDEPFLVIFPATRLYEFQQAFKQAFTAIAASSATSNAAVSNVFQDAGFKIKLWPTARITTDTAFVISEGIHSTYPLIGESVSLPLEERFYDASNSPEHGDLGIEELVWEMWQTPVNNLPRGAVQITT